MVKKAKTAKVDVGGRPARDPETLRTERLVLRVHSDFLDILQLRADELRMTRSRYVEEIIRSVLALDPRNPRFDRNGKIDATAPPEAEMRLRNPLNYLNQLAMSGGIPPQPSFGDIAGIVSRQNAKRDREGGNDDE